MVEDLEWIQPYNNHYQYLNVYASFLTMFSELDAPRNLNYLYKAIGGHRNKFIIEEE